MCTETWHILENERVYSKRNMKFAIRQKDKAIHLDMKKNVTLLHWKGEFLPHLGVTNPQTGLTAFMDLWVAARQLCQVVVASPLAKNSGGQCRTQRHRKTNWAASIQTEP